MGVSCFNAKRYDEAVPLLREGISIERKASGGDSETALSLASYLVEAETGLGHFAEAERIVLSALDTLPSRLAASSSFKSLDVMPVLWGKTCQRAGHPERLAGPLDKMIAAVEAKTANDDPAVARGLLLVARAYDEYGTPDQSRACLERALAIQRTRLAADDLVLAETLSRLGSLASRLAQYADSESYFQSVWRFASRNSAASIAWSPNALEISDSSIFAWSATKRRRLPSAAPSPWPRRSAARPIGRGPTRCGCSGGSIPCNAASRKRKQL